MFGHVILIMSRRVALLLCGRVPVEAAKQHGDFGEQLTRLLASDGEEWVHFDVENGQLPEDLASFDSVVMSGSEASVTDGLPWMVRIEELLKQAVDRRRKVLGICFGAQLLAHALGGEVARAPALELGARKVDVDLTALKRRPYAKHFDNNTFNIAQFHEDAVVRLPPGAELLGSSPGCRNELYALGDLMLGVQGHPEWDAAFMHTCLGVVADKIPDGQDAQARESLERYDIASPTSPTNDFRNLCRAFLQQ